MNPRSNLWPHQVEALERTDDAIINGRKSGLWSMPTGTGKTRTFCTLMRELDLPALVLVHRGELVTQTINTLADVHPGATVGVVQAERDEWHGVDVCIAMVPSLHAKRLERIPANRFGLVIADEAHHAAADSWRRVISHFEPCFTLGVSATPERLDGQGLDDLFGDEPLYRYTLRQAIEDGRLCGLRQLAIKTSLDLSGVQTRCGDFAENQLEQAVNTHLQNAAVVDAFRTHAPERRAIAFCVGIAHAEALTQAFKDAGIVADLVTGKTPDNERRRLLADFGAGRIQVLCNCQVLTEGFDDRGVSCVVMARPTQSRALYTQCVGRGLRRLDGKADCLVLDFTPNSTRHRLVTVADLLGREKPEAEATERDEQIERTRQPATAPVDGPVRWRSREVSPWPTLPTLDGYRPWQRWQYAAATEKQFQCLRSFGLEVTQRLTKGEASYLIDRCKDFEAEYPPPATTKQKAYLSRRGAWREGLTKREASRLIGMMKQETELVGV